MDSSNVKWVSVTLKELARQCRSTVAYLKERMLERDIPLIHQNGNEAVAKKYMSELAERPPRERGNSATSSTTSGPQ